MTKQTFLKDHSLEFTLDIDQVIRDCFERLEQKISNKVDTQWAGCNFRTDLVFLGGESFLLRVNTSDEVISLNFQDSSFFDTPGYQEVINKIAERIAYDLELDVHVPQQKELIETVLSISSQAEFTNPKDAYNFINEYIPQCHPPLFFQYVFDELANFKFDYKMFQQLIQFNPPIIMNVHYMHRKALPIKRYIDLQCNIYPSNYIAQNMFRNEPYYILTGMPRFAELAYEEYLIDFKQLFENYTHLFKIRRMVSPEHAVNKKLPNAYYNTVPPHLRPYSEEL